MTQRKFTPPTSFPAEYRNGYGQKVVIFGHGEGTFPFVGQVHRMAGVGLAAFTMSGSQQDHTQYHENDLHDLPKEHVTYINEYADGESTEHLIRRGAEVSKKLGRIAVTIRRQIEGELPTYETLSLDEWEEWDGQ